MPVLETVDLRKTYRLGDREAEGLRGVTVQIERGEFVSMMGPSGSGKSTFLHLAGALDRASSGNVLVGGKSLGEMNDATLSRFRRTQLGFVFEELRQLAEQHLHELPRGHRCAIRVPEARHHHVLDGASFAVG